MSDTTGVRAPTMTEPIGVSENVSKHGPRVVPDNMTQTAVMKTQEID